MRVTIHQPNYLPHFGFFQKMALADIFIFLDTVQFSKDSYTQRTRIRTKTGWIWLTIPIERKYNFKLINEVYLPQINSWIEKHKISILSNYSKATFYDDNFIEQYYSANFIKFKDFNEYGILYLKKMFDIKTKIITASELNINNNLKSTDLLIELIKKVGGNTYISGWGGKNYLDESKFKKEGIDLIYFKSEPFEYKQRWGGFESYMSSIDLLFNLGEESKNFITNDKKE